MLSTSAPRVFVSYSTQDVHFAQQLASDLSAAGAEVWYDQPKLDSGDFVQRISSALGESEWLVLVLTPHSIASPYVQMEAGAAMNRMVQGRMRGIIPILAMPCDPGTIPPLWDVLHRYDATRDYNGALAGVLRALGLSPSQGLASATSVPAIPSSAASSTATHETPPVPQIFCAHSSADSEFGSRLVVALRRALGKEDTVWYDELGGTEVGDHFWRKIVQEIAARPIFMIITSPDAMESNWVNNELDIAVTLKNRKGAERNRRIIPIFHRDCELRVDLLALQGISFMPPATFDEAISKLLQAVTKSAIG